MGNHNVLFIYLIKIEFQHIQIILITMICISLKLRANHSNEKNGFQYKLITMYYLFNKNRIPTYSNYSNNNDLHFINASCKSFQLIDRENRTVSNIATHWKYNL